MHTHAHADLHARGLTQFTTRTQRTALFHLQDNNERSLNRNFDLFLSEEKHKRDGPDGGAHVQPHLNTVPGVVGDGVRQSRHTVVTVPQDLDAQTPVFLQTSTASHSQTGRKCIGVGPVQVIFTLAMSSNLPKSLLSTATSSCGEHELASLVKPTMSAYKMLHKENNRESQKHTLACCCVSSYV